jgi:MYXO-CTERM domain-containing protein
MHGEMRSLILPCTFFVASLAAGCNTTDHTASLYDGFANFSFDNRNLLHTPYVAGSQFTISVGTGAHATNDGWQVTSSNPDVLALSPSTTTTTQFQAIAGQPGHTTLSVVDVNGKVLDTAGVDVDVPTRIQLCEQGLLYAGVPDDQAALSSVQVVNGGTATFLARYFSGSQELWGNNALTAKGTPQALARVVSTSFSISDFVQVTGASSGATTVHLAAGGGTLDVPVTVVDPAVVEHVALLAQSPGGASDGTTLAVFARATDSNGSDVYGSSFSWTADGQVLPGYVDATDPTDLLMYSYHPSSSEQVEAQLGSENASATVHGSPASTYTQSSGDTGCSVGRGGGSGSSAVAGVLVGLAVLAARRRREVR